MIYKTFTLPLHEIDLNFTSLQYIKSKLNERKEGRKVKRKRFSQLFLLGGLLLLLSGCGNQTQNKITVVGSTALQPLVERLQPSMKRNMTATLPFKAAVQEPD